jgi:hypothetical protein
MIRSDMLSPSSGSKSTLKMEVFSSETLVLISNIISSYSLEKDEINPQEFRVLITSKLFITKHTVINHSLLYISANNSDKVDVIDHTQLMYFEL